MTKKAKWISFACVVAFSLVLLISFSTISANAASVKQGAKGEMVKTIQTKLKSWGFYTGSVDGVFGANTTKAVKSFQKKNKLTADGIVGNATAKQLGINNFSDGNSSSGGTTSKPGSVSSDVYLMAKAVYGESRGEPYVGKVAVAAVILNRVKSSKFPNTISGVIYQPWAFTAVNDGQINLGTNDECIKAVQAAMNGWDPSYGCIYYYNPKTATNKWIRGRKIIATIGRHVFCV